MFNNTKFQELILELSANDIHTYYVGGCVRDKFMGKASDDIDICVIGVKDVDFFVGILDKYSDNTVNNATNEVSDDTNKFPVWIADFDGNKIDFALGRKEKKDGMTRKDFLCDVEGIIIEEDLLRRDLTINAIAINCVTGAVVDPFNGVYHIKMKLAHPVSKAFSDDPLRVIRAARFISNDELTASPKLIDTCQNMTPKGMANDRVGTELYKMFKQGNPESFFSFLQKVGWFDYFFKGIEMKGMHFASSFTHPFAKMAATFYHSDLRVLETRLRKIVFLSHNEINKISIFIKAVKTINAGLLDREQSIKVWRTLVKNDLAEPSLINVFFKTLQMDVKKLNPYKAHIIDAIYDPIVTGDMLKEKGYKEGKELGLLKKKLLSLQDKGVLSKSNFESFIPNI